MPEVYNFNETEIIAFFLIFMRLIAFIVSWPVFGAPTVSTPLKVLFSMALALLLFPVTDYSAVNANFDSFSLIGLTIREVFIGLTIGYLCHMFFFAVRIAADIMSTSIGLASAQLFNPMVGSQTTSIEQFKIILASLFYLTIQGHHLFISGLSKSFQLLPVGELALSFGGLMQITTFAQSIMEIGLKMSAPVLVSLLFMNIAMAVIGRAVPQINILITSLPVNIIVGLFVMIIGMPLFLWQMQDVLEFSTERMFHLLRTF